MNNIPFFSKLKLSSKNTEDERERREIVANSNLKDLLDFIEIPQTKNNKETNDDDNNDENENDNIEKFVKTIDKYEVEGFGEQAMVCDHFLTLNECKKIIDKTNEYGYGRTNYHPVRFFFFHFHFFFFFFVFQ